MSILLSDGGWMLPDHWSMLGPSSSPGCLALLSVTQGRTEGPGQGTEAVGAEDGGGLQGTYPT